MLRARHTTDPCGIRQPSIGVKLIEGPAGTSVAATVHEVQRYGPIPHRIEATGVSDLNAQSPSERCDGDCALRPAEPIASRLWLGRACHRPSGTVAATEGA